MIVCIQGDEPLMRPHMINAVVALLKKGPNIPGTVLAMHIVDEELWKNPGTVKNVHNAKSEILYTSRIVDFA